MLCNAGGGLTGLGIERALERRGPWWGWVKSAVGSARL